MEKERLTLVVPAYNEEEAIPIFYKEAKKVEEKLPQVEVEYLFIDDGSSDATLDVLRRLSEEDGMVHYVSFSRNFGKESAIYAGLQKASGEYVAIMDADLQDPPALLPQMLLGIMEEAWRRLLPSYSSSCGRWYLATRPRAGRPWSVSSCW